MAVKRGPLVYCLESADLPAGENVFDIALPAAMQWHTVPFQVAQGHLMALEGTARLLPANNGNSLYREVNLQTKPTHIRLIPYYAWANRGQGDMSVWMPVVR